MSLGSFPCWFRWLVNILRKGCEEKNKEGILPNLPPQVPSSRSADVRLDLWIQSCSCPLVGPAAEPKVGPCSPINTRLFGSSPDRVNLVSGRNCQGIGRYCFVLHWRGLICREQFGQRFEMRKQTRRWLLPFCPSPAKGPSLVRNDEGATAKVQEDGLGGGAIH